MERRIGSGHIALTCSTSIWKAAGESFYVVRSVVSASLKRGFLPIRCRVASIVKTFKMRIPFFRVLLSQLRDEIIECD